ncbi:MAG: IS66 family transposase [Candidatus Obscuribacterales bacterium]|nr:IS66 family transposase [Candidatus Obscuribacterales bacterium]
MGDDVKQLNEEIIRLVQQNETLQRQLTQALEGNEELRALLKDLQAKLDVLIAQSKKRNKRDYGKKTEKHNPRPATSTPKPAADAELSDQNNKTTGIKHILENAKNIPHETVPHKVKPEDLLCPDCSVETVLVGNVITHQLEMISASLKILEHLQETRACPRCKQHIITAEKTGTPIPGSYAGPRLIGEVIVGKLEDGLPNYRQEKIFARHNIKVPRSTQCDWMQATANTLWILYDMMKKELLLSNIIKTDDSSIKIQDRKHKNNIRKGKMTTYIGVQRDITMFDFSPDLSFDKNLEFLKDFEGTVQADAAGGFDALFQDGKRIEAGCSAHSRRKYFEAEFSESDVRNAVLDVYSALYNIEREIKDKPALFRLAIRRRKSKPLVKRLREIIVRANEKFHPTHELAKAINYTLKHWRALTRFLKDPDIAIDNNEAERAIKCWVLVRKNSLFAGSDAGAKAIAIHLSFIATANINPVDWYADVLARINAMKTTDVQQLLPQHWTPPAVP